MIKTKIYFTCKICDKIYQKTSSCITLYDEKQDNCTQMSVCNTCFKLFENMIKGLCASIAIKKTKKKKKGMTKSQATRWALDHVS